MKLKGVHITRPEIKIEYVGIRGFCAAVAAVFKVGIKRVKCNWQIKGCEQWGIVQVTTVYVVPKYVFERVKDIPPPQK